MLTTIFLQFRWSEMHNGRFFALLDSNVNCVVMKKYLYLLLFFITFSSCEIFEGAVDEPGPPDIAEGLKEALRVGAQFASDDLGAADGYFGNELYKILLPDDIANNITAFKEASFLGFTGADVYSTGLQEFGIPSLQSLEDELILGINRAAESAATEAAPIFIDAIAGITIQDADNILFGGQDDAATQYLRDNTYTALFSTYEPQIDAAISNVTVGNTDVETLYANFVTTYNNVLSTEVVPIIGTTVADLTELNDMENVDLSEFATGEGLDALFLRVQQEEANIRENPLARINDLLQEVFGLLD